MAIVAGGVGANAGALCPVRPVRPMRPMLKGARSFPLPYCRRIHADAGTAEAMMKVD